MMRFFLMAVVVMASCVVNAQDFDNYKTLLPQGTVPKDFTEYSASKVASQVTEITEGKGRVKRAKKKFVLESTFGIDEFLSSGSVMFNDEVTVYLDNVLQELLKPYPALQQKIRVYAVKSSAVNAFTTNDGMIFVNMGLLSRLENEAQLAFVLSHEIVHYQKKHVINSYVTNVEMSRSRDFRKLSVSEKGFARSSYAKELESEADLEGVEIFLKSKYAIKAPDQVMGILHLADHPTSWITFSKQYFESPNYIFPDTLSLKTSPANFSIDEDYDDSRMTHPNIRKRREALNGKVYGKSDGQEYIVSKARFLKSKKIAQFELCRLYLLEHQFADALSLAHSLQSENPSSSYIRETIAKACYGIAKLKLNDELDLEWKRWAGEPERVAHFLLGQSAYELSVLAIRQLYICKELTPGNEEISLMLNDIMKDFANEYDGVTGNFLRKPSDKRRENLTYPYTQSAFLDFKDSKTFFQVFDKQAVKEKVIAENTKKKKSKTKTRRVPLNINKVVVVNPMYKKIDARKKRNRVRHVDAEEVLININQKILDAASELSMKTDIINANNISANQVSLMQDNSIMNDWIDEQMRSEYKIISPIYNEVVAVADAHKTDHFVWMGGITVREKVRPKGWAIIGGVVVPAATPWSVYHLWRPAGRTLYFALVYNVRKQEMEFIDIRFMEMKDTEMIMQSNIYYTLFKLKK